MRGNHSRARNEARRSWLAVCVCGILVAVFHQNARAADRVTLSLDGQWQIAKSAQPTPPSRYEAAVPVPGLVDMAKPPFEGVGQPAEAPGFFYYRRTFTAPQVVPACALLKIHKAKYGTAVWLNGKPLGEHLPSFTPSYWDLRPLIQAGAENELVVRVGAGRESLPQGMPTGWDFEKYRYLPGIYDSVKLILCDGPRIANVQCVPDIKAKRVRLLVELHGGKKAVPAAVQAEIAESKSGRVVSSGAAEGPQLVPGAKRVLDITLPVPDCRLWWPEDPFLYEARLTTAGDSLTVRFGMRSFRFDPATKRAVLNGQQRYLCGANVTVYRFFEDALRGNKPWDREWVRKLHRQFKTMHWDTLRYCIGFPPDFWYDIADEEGFLIQDEFPIWTLGDDPEELEAAKIVPEYTAWMRQRWNHPSVVIWDAQNESRTPVTGQALQAVRHLDYSNRPWENGWGKPQSIYDCVESHPYLFSRGMPWQKGEPFRLAEIPGVDPVPRLNAEQKALDVPIIINEYDWLWLTRDGNPTCLTKHNYDFHVGPDATAQQRRHFRARGVAALTEFWRAHRNAAAVLHFCGLGYSRPGDKPRPEGGATSDDFVDIATLEFEPMFKKYVGMAFNPVGIMLDFWKEEVAPGQTAEGKVWVINDRQQPWRGEVRLRLQGREDPLARVNCQVEPLGRQLVTFDFPAPANTGDYTLIAELTDGKETVQSLRDFEVADVFLGSGVKVGEIRSTSAIVHVRLTSAPEQDDTGRIPGCEGTARLEYVLRESGDAAAMTPWRQATAEEDYSIQFHLKDLEPGRRYHYRVQYRSGGEKAKRSPAFSFKTAPAPDKRAVVKFQVTTGQDYRGENTYRHMAAQQPDFLVSTGDNVYYDGPPNARDVQGAYDAYQMMYGLPLMKKYFEHIGGYFEKDDHDYRFNDADRWQQWKAGDGGRRRGKKQAKPEKWLTHEEGIMVFKQVFPMSDPTYRTFRWGQGLQIWLVEGRDYRSPNAMPDGPDKTLWGQEQLAWLKRTLLESDADWRVLISPTPIIGPDRVTKTDNHANPKGFWTEGQAFLDWIKDNNLDNLVLVCGDRHWQYESLDRRNGRAIYEYSCGPTCDEHTARVPPITEAHHGVTQPYSASRGGFLTVTYRPDRTLSFEFFDQEGKLRYRRVFPH